MKNGKSFYATEYAEMISQHYAVFCNQNKILRINIPTNITLLHHFRQGYINFMHPKYMKEKTLFRIDDITINMNYLKLLSDVAVNSDI